MRFKAPIWAAAAGIALVVSSAIPASAAVSDAQIQAARDAAVTRAEAAKLGIKADVSTFTVTDVRSAKGTRADIADIWLCDSPTGANIKVPGSRVQFTSVHSQLDGLLMRNVEQTTYQYASAKQARAAYKALTTEAKKCSGTQTEAEGNFSFSTTLSNGTSKVADGDSVVWVLTEGSSGTGTKDYTSHDYGTFHLDGDVIVAVEIDHDGPDAPVITAAQRKQANELACDSVHRS